MTFVAPNRMEWLFQRCHKEAVLYSVFRSVLLMLCSLLVLSVSMYPGLWSIGVHLHSAFTGSYIPGHHSVLLINSPNEQAAKDIGRAIMERRLAASINILSRTSTMYYWKESRTARRDVTVVAAGEDKDLQDPASHRLCEVFPSLCKPRSAQLSSAGRQSGLHEVDG
uniref:protein CutA homolog isoform X2 n=1 Tax=Scatophagus argus TaxID=75038 RepID=UPI001ED7D666|nr:protein CutA homolog isoform X2 [Scatophagus argus]